MKNKKNKIIIYISIVVFIVGFLLGFFYTNFKVDIKTENYVSIQDIFVNNITIMYINVLLGIVSFGIYSNINLIFQGIGMGSAIKCASLNNLGLLKILLGIVAHGFFEISAIILANVLVIKTVSLIFNLILKKINNNTIIINMKQIAIFLKYMVVITILTLLAAVIEGTVSEMLYNMV